MRGTASNQWLRSIWQSCICVPFSDVQHVVRMFGACGTAAPHSEDNNPCHTRGIQNNQNHPPPRPHASDNWALDRAEGSAQMPQPAPDFGLTRDPSALLESVASSRALPARRCTLDRSAEYDPDLDGPPHVCSCIANSTIHADIGGELLHLHQHRHNISRRSQYPC